MIGFCGGLIGEEVFLISLEGMLEFLDETWLRRNQPYTMVMFKGRSKG